MSRKVFTFGCRLNSFESEVIKDNLASCVDDNIAVFNTCAVTKEAERQAKQAIRKFIKDNPNSKVIVTGCAAQINPQIYADISGVTKVIGNEEKLSSRNYDFTDSDEQVKVNDIMEIQEIAPHLITGQQDKSRAFIQVQNGCNHRCTFCIIPYGRGNSRSVPIGQIVEQAKILVANGYNEIILTGVDISDYGSNLAGKPTLGEMMRRLLTLVPQLPRLRLSSIDVAEIDDMLLDLITNEPRFMPYLHLSLQAGDDMVLKRMKRRHNRQQIIDFCNQVRKLRPDIAFGADIIAGFPTETDEMFNNTLNLVEEIGISYLHVFPYSKREGTPAAAIPDDKQVASDVKKHRAALLRSAGHNSLAKQLSAMVGNNEKIIIEQNHKGRTENFAIVKLKNDYVVGSIIEIKIANSDKQQLFE